MSIFLFVNSIVAVQHNQVEFNRITGKTAEIAFFENMDQQNAAIDLNGFD